MSCTKITITNSAPSSLYDTIYNQLSNESTAIADNHYSFFQSNAFRNDFGDWITEYQNGEHVNNTRVDENGEPILFIDEQTEKFYYINRFGDHVEFPKKSITDSFTQREIDTAVSQLAKEYFFAHSKDAFNISYDSMTDVDTFISDAIEARSDVLLESENYDAYETLLTMQDYSQELTDRVKEFYKNIGLTIVTQDEFNDDFESLMNDDGASNTRDASFSMSSYEKNPMLDLSTEIKQLLTFITDKQAPLTYWGEQPLIPLTKAYNQLMEVLANTVPTANDGTMVNIFDNQIEIIRLLAEVNPSYLELYTQLSRVEKDNPIRNKFAQTFNKSKNNYMQRELSYSKEGFKHTTYHMSDVGGGSVAINNTNMIDMRLKLIDLNTGKPSGSNIEVFKDVATNTNASNIISQVAKLGITLTDAHLDFIAKDLKVTTVNQEVKDANLDKFAKDLSRSMLRFMTSFASQYNVNFDNTYKAETIFVKIAKAQSFFNGNASEGSILLGGKQQYVYSNPSYVDSRINSFKKHPSLLEGWNKLSAYNRGSVIMPFLLGQDIDTTRRQDRSEIARLQAINLDAFESAIFSAQVVNDDKRRGTPGAAKEMSHSDYTVDAINTMLSKDGFVRTTTPADKGTDRQLRNGYRMEDTTFVRESDYYLNSTVKYTFSNYLFSEVERMREAWGEIQKAVVEGTTKDLILHYHVNEKQGLFDKDGNIKLEGLGNAFKSQLYSSISATSKHPKGSPEAMIIEALYNPIFISAKGIIKKEDIANISILSDVIGNTDLVKVTTTAEGNDFNKLISDFVEVAILRRIGNRQNTLVNSDIIVLNDEGLIDITKSKIDSEILNKYLSNEHLQNVPHTDIANMIFADFMVNGMVQHIEYSKMFTGDFAFYKNMVDYKKRVPATYTDGLQLALDEVDSEFTVAVTSAIMAGSSVHSELVELLGEEGAAVYGPGKINSADAQAWITPERWKFLLEKMGKFGEVEQRVFEKLNSTTPVTFDKYELKAAAQPLKGVYFYMNGKVPTYMKYSQAVISPNITGSGSEMRKIYDAMREGKVDELVTVDAFKVGSTIPDTVHTPEGKVADNIVLNTRKLKNAGWKLQQDLPTKTYKDINVGSQIQKNVFAGLNFLGDSETFFVDSKKEMLKGSAIIKEIVETTGRLSDLGYTSLEKEFGIDTNGVITNKKAYYRAINEELAERGNLDAIVAIERGLSSYAIPSVGLKIDQIFASIVTKRLIKIQTNGGSLIQMSNFGISKTGSASSIIWSPELAEGSTAYEPTPYIDEEGRKRVNPAGVLISGSFIAKYIPDYTKYSPEELFGYTNEEGNFVRGKIDPQILDKFIGYRIPNQGLSSNIAMKVVGILPPTHGDTIVAYTGITAQTGSDFDIDKMFIMAPAYNARTKSKMTNSQARHIVNTFFKGVNIKATINNTNEFLKAIGIDDLSHHNLTNDKFEQLSMVRDTFTTAINNKDFSELPQVIEIKKYLESIDPEFNTVTHLDYIVPSGKPSVMNKKQAQNHLVELYKSVLNSTDVIGNVLKPIDDDTFKDETLRAVAGMKANSNADLFHVDPIDDIDLLFSFRKGKLGVAQEANAMVDVNRQGSLVLMKTNLGRGNYNTKTGNTDLDPEYSEGLSNEDLFFHINEVYNEDGTPFSKLFPEITNADIFRTAISKDPKYSKLRQYIYTIDKMKTATSYTSVMNAFVDIAKDPFITDGNWASSTTNAGNLMLRAGIHPFFIINLMAQPIIKDYVDFLTSNSEYGDSFDNYIKKVTVDYARAKYSTEPSVNIKRGENIPHIKITLKNLMDKIQLYGVNERNLEWFLQVGFKLHPGAISSISEEDMNQLESMYETLVSVSEDMISSRKIDASTFSMEKLRKSLNGKPDPNVQIASLEYFRNIQQMSKNLAETLNISKTDTDGLGGTMSNIFAISNAVKNVLSKEANYSDNDYNKGVIGGYATRLKDTVLGKYLANIERTKKIVNANSDLFPHGTEKVQDIFNKISESISGTPLIDQALTKELEVEFRSFVLGNYFNIDGVSAERLLRELPKRLERFKAKLKADGLQGEYAIIDELYVEPAVNNAAVADDFSAHGINVKVQDRISMTKRFKDKYHTANLTKSWDRLFNDFPTIANELFEYAFLTSSYTMSPGQFFSVAPHTPFVLNKKVNGEYRESFNQVLSRVIADPSTFYEKFFENNSINFKIVSSVASYNEYTKRGAKYDITSKQLDVQLSPSDTLRPYVNYKITNTITGLFKLEGVNMTVDGTIGHYELIPRKGYQGKSVKVNIKDYSLDNSISNNLRNADMNKFLTNVKPFTQKFDYTASEYFKMLAKGPEVEVTYDELPVTSNATHKYSNNSTYLELLSTEPLSKGSIAQYKDKPHVILGTLPSGLIQIMSVHDDSNRKLTVKPSNLTQDTFSNVEIHLTNKGIMTSYGDIYIDHNNKKTTKEVVLAASEKFEMNNEGSAPIQPTKVVREEVKEEEPVSLVTLTDTQAKVKQGVLDFIKSDKRVLTIKGKAGTGKTTVMGEVIRDIVKDNKVLISALSHKAKNVLDVKARAVLKGTDFDVMSLSIAGALGAQMNEETGRFIFPKDDSLVLKPIDSYNIVIIDEASMVNEEAFALINDSMVSKIIYVGDPGQLPPIRENGNVNEGKISPAFNNDLTLELFERIRQGEDSSILPYADYYWNNSQNPEGQIDNPIPNSARNDSNELKFETFSKEGLTKYIPLFKKGVEDSNFNLIKMVVYHNKLRSQLNSHIRNSIFDKPEEFMKGDLIMLNESYDTQNEHGDEMSLQNSDELIIEKIKYYEKEGLKFATLTVNHYGDSILIDTVVPSDREKFNKRIDGLRNTALSFTKGSREYKQAFKDMYVFKKLSANVDYAYAITSHKSQGSTYETVIVFEDDIMSNSYTTAKSKSQAMYTAITRASKEAIIMSSISSNTIDKNTTGNGNTSKVLDNASTKGAKNFGNTSVENTTPLQPEDYVNNSGGADGADTEWDIAGRDFGVVNHKHYYLGEVTPIGNTPISHADMIEGQRKATEAGRIMGRIEPTHNVSNEKLIRNWSQVKYSDSVIAIGTMVSKGSEMRYGKIAKVPQVEGGTGWAVQMAINEGKPVTMFDQVRKAWYKYDHDNKKWVKSETPTLTKNFAGIGTTKINQEGINAIRDVYVKTFNNRLKSSGFNSELPKGYKSVELNDAEVFIGTPFTVEQSSQVFDIIQKSFTENYNSQKAEDKFGNVRRSMYYSDTPYRYSGTTRRAQPNPKWLDSLITKVEDSLGVEKGYFDMSLINEYKDGNQKIGFHTDNEATLNAGNTVNPTVVTVSFGDTRTMILQDGKGGETSFEMPSGSVAVMGYNSQINYKHGIKQESNKGLRYSITLRHNAVKRASSIKTPYYSGDIKPDTNTVFVFGSNPIGVNGNPSRGTGGAALVASQQFGVKQGEKMTNRLSDSGKAFGLVTVTGPGARRSMTPSQIEEGIKILYRTALENPSKQFKVAYRNTDKASLNGYTGLEMIQMFDNVGPRPENVIFSKEWYDKSELKSNQIKQVTPNVLNVLNDDWRNTPVYSERGINVMRTENRQSSNAHFGNPFSEAGYSSTIKVDSVADTIQHYKDWLLTDKYSNINPEQRTWVLDQINKGSLDNAVLLYSKKLAGRGLGSHAEGLRDVVSQLRSNGQQNTAQPVISTPTLDFTKATTEDKINALPPLAQTKIKGIVDNHLTITLSPDNKHYVNKNTGTLYNRVTKALDVTIDYLAEDFAYLDSIEGFNIDSKGMVTIKPEILERIKTESLTGQNLFDKNRYTRIMSQKTPLLRFKTATIVGNKIDIFIRTFFDNDRISLADLNAVSPIASVQQSMLSQARHLKAFFDGRGEVVIPKDVTLYNDTYGIAGTVDLMTVDQQGNFRIYDIKTNKDVGSLYKTYDSTNVEGDTDTTKQKPSKFEKYSKQVNVYRTLMNNTHGVSAVELGLFVFDVQYDGSNGDSNIQDIYYDDKRFINVPLQNEIVPFGAEELISEQQEMYNQATIAQKFLQFKTMVHNDNTTINMSKVDGTQRNITTFLYAHKEMLEAKYGPGSLATLFEKIKSEGLPPNMLNNEYLLKCLNG